MPQEKQWGTADRECIRRKEDPEKIPDCERVLFRRCRSPNGDDDEFGNTGVASCSALQRLLSVFSKVGLIRAEARAFPLAESQLGHLRHVEYW